MIDLDESEFSKDNFMVYMDPNTGLYKCTSLNSSTFITIQSVAGNQGGLVNFYNSSNTMLRRKTFLDAEDIFQDTLNYNELCEIFSSFFTYS